MVPPDSHGISRAPCYLGSRPEVAQVSPTGVSPSVPALSRTFGYQSDFLLPAGYSSPGRAVPQPRSRNACWLSHATGLACSPFAHHYSGNRGCFLFLWVLRCFTSPRYLHLPYVFRQGRRAITPARFPHSEIPGSKSGCRLPGAYRRLLRPSSAPGAKASTVRP